MSELRKKAMTRLAICAVALVASIIFSVLLLTGTFDGKTDSGDAAPATSDTTSAAAGHRRHRRTPCRRAACRGAAR